jgi:hypothetical protein
MPKATVQANARSLPEATKRPAAPRQSQKILQELISFDRDELLKQPPSPVRTEELAACERLLEGLARLVSEKGSR